MLLWMIYRRHCHVFLSFFFATQYNWTAPSFLLSPVCPEEMDWSELYADVFTGNPSDKETPQVEFADIGCGYGGLLGSSVALPTSKQSSQFTVLLCIDLVSPSLMSLCGFTSGVIATLSRQAHPGHGDPSQSVWLCSGSYRIPAWRGTRTLPEHRLHSHECDEISPQLLL